MKITNIDTTRIIAVFYKMSRINIELLCPNEIRLFNDIQYPSYYYVVGYIRTEMYELILLLNDKKK